MLICCAVPLALAEELAAEQSAGTALEQGQLEQGQPEQDPLEDVSQFVIAYPTADDVVVPYYRGYASFDVHIRNAPKTGTYTVTSDSASANGITLTMKDYETVHVEINYGTPMGRYTVTVKYEDTSDVAIKTECTFDLILEAGNHSNLSYEWGGMEQYFNQLLYIKKDQKIGLSGIKVISDYNEEVRTGYIVRDYTTSDGSTQYGNKVIANDGYISFDVSGDDNGYTLFITGLKETPENSCVELLNEVNNDYDTQFGSIYIVVTGEDTTNIPAPVESLQFTQEITEIMNIGDEPGLLIAQAKRLDGGDLVDYDDAKLIWKVEREALNDNGEYLVNGETALKLYRAVDGVDGAMKVEAYLPGTYDITASAVYSGAIASTTVVVDKLAPDAIIANSIGPVQVGSTIDLKKYIELQNGSITEKATESNKLKSGLTWGLVTDDGNFTLSNDGQLTISADCPAYKQCYITVTSTENSNATAKLTIKTMDNNVSCLKVKNGETTVAEFRKYDSAYDGSGSVSLEVGSMLELTAETAVWTSTGAGAYAPANDVSWKVTNTDPTDKTVYAIVENGRIVGMNACAGAAILEVSYGSDICAKITLNISPAPTPSPTQEPTPAPSPTREPTPAPSPTQEPTQAPSPTVRPNTRPTVRPTIAPTPEPTPAPTPEPTPRIGVVSNVETRLNIRAEASTQSAVLTTVENRTQLRILGQEGGFYKVELADGTVGYAMTDYVYEIVPPEPTATPAPTVKPEPVERSGVVVNVSTNLNIRESASTKSAVVSKVKNATQLAILGEEGDFYKVKLSNGITGYASKAYVREITSGAEEYIGQATVTTSSGALNLRATPNGVVITTMPRGTTLKLLMHASDWCRVEYKGVVGYASTQYLQVTLAPVG